ncbi:MAG: hypothetical protein IJJ33_04140 [Victivallales bacterium]|nr:hypothetical protein [Victivallales bacterium]
MRMRIWCEMVFAVCAMTLAAGEERLSKVPLEKRERQFARTLFFPRAHLKYNLATNCFRQRQPGDWIDRPLFGDHYDMPKEELPFGGRQAFLDGVEICRDYGFDGYAALVITVSDSYISRMERMFEWLPAESQFLILPELTIFKNIFDDPALAQAVSGRKPDQEVLFDRIFKAAMFSPHAVRHNGKLVISSYMGDSLAPEDWRGILDYWRRHYGDTFLFVPEIRMPLYNKRVPFTTKGGLTLAEIDEMKAALRSYLEVCDGVHFAACNHLATAPDNRYYTLEFFRDMVVPVMVSVLNEPAYRGKLLGLGVAKGYINHRSNSNILEEGTKILRGTYEAAMAANPDYVILVEWNEMNENTNIEPTVCEGLTNQHIFRNYAGLPNANRAGEPTPNLIVSIPWARSYGETLHLELLHLPEKDFSQAFTATLSLRNEAGQSVWHASREFPGGVRKAEQFTIPSETLAPAAFLHPVLNLRYADGQSRVIDDGLGCIRLHGGPNIVCKDVKTPIRDLPHLTKCVATLTQEGSLTMARVNVQAREKLRFVELVRNHYTVWSASADIPGDTLKIRLSFNGWSSLNERVPFIRLRVENGRIAEVDDFLRHWSGIRYQREGEDTLLLPAPQVNYGTMRGIAFTVTPTGAAESCAIRMELGKNHSYRFAVADLEGAGQNITDLGCASEFRLARAREVMDEPSALDCTEVDKVAVLGPSSPGDLWELRVVTMEGGVYHSRALPMPAFAESPLCDETVESESAGMPVAISVRQAVWPTLEYRFRKSVNGWLTVTAPGCDDQFAILGGGCSVAYPFQNPARHPHPEIGGRPQWRSEKNVDYLHFDGKNDYIIFPAAAVPFRSFRISFRLRPEVEGTQFLMAQQGKSGGTIAQVLLDKGGQKVILRDRASKGYKFTSAPDLRFREWNDVELACHAGRFRIAINGKTSVDEALGKFEGLRANPLVFGGWDKKTPYFQGDLSSFLIR